MTDLTDRMRTCAAHLATASIVANPAAIDDAAALLNEAADALDASPAPLGEPMEILPPAAIPTPPVVAPAVGPAQWAWAGDQLRLAAETARKSNACPTCDSRAGKRVRVLGKDIWLTCGCGASWKKQA